MRLPIIPAEYTAVNSDIYLHLNDYPCNEQYLELFDEKLSEPEYDQYLSFSIFNPQKEAGLRSDGTLMSEEEFKEEWQSYNLEQSVQLEEE